MFSYVGNFLDIISSRNTSPSMSSNGEMGSPSRITSKRLSSPSKITSKRSSPKKNLTLDLDITETSIFVPEAEEIEKFVISIKVNAFVKSFAPSIFVKLRNINGIQEFDIINSLVPINNREQIFKSNQQTSRALTSNGGGRSSSFFFFSQDKQFIVKTITKSEIKTLL